MGAKNGALFELKDLFSLSPQCIRRCNAQLISRIVLYLIKTVLINRERALCAGRMAKNSKI